MEWSNSDNNKRMSPEQIFSSMEYLLHSTYTTSPISIFPDKRISETAAFTPFLDEHMTWLDGPVGRSSKIKYFLWPYDVWPIQCK